MLGNPPPASEVELWAKMDPSHRQRAAVRLDVLGRWLATEAGLTAKDAASQAGISVSRFYRMVNDWQRSPSLAAIGARVPQSTERRSKFDATVINRLQAAVVKVVSQREDRSVRQMVAALRESVDAGGASLPGETVLREIVERELRRRAAQSEIGNAVVFDCATLSLARPDGRPWMIFAFIDRGSQLVLGFALGDLDTSAEACSSAASDVLARLSRSQASSLPWASMMTRLDAVVGSDEDAWRERISAFKASGIGTELVPVTSDRRWGKYFRKYVGQSLGRVILLSGKASLTPVPNFTGPGYSTEEVIVRLEAEVASRNAAIIATMPPVSAERSPPAGLITTLEFLARQV